jgi:hypothetical protein
MGIWCEAEGSVRTAEALERDFLSEPRGRMLGFDGWEIEGRVAVCGRLEVELDGPAKDDRCGFEELFGRNGARWSSSIVSRSDRAITGVLIFSGSKGRSFPFAFSVSGAGVWWLWLRDTGVDLFLPVRPDLAPLPV